MKNLLFFLLLISWNLFSQNEKDTLFFKADKDYILFNEDYKKWRAPSSFKDFKREILKKFLLTNTQGYFMFKKIDTLYNLTPKKNTFIKRLC